jgi:hypothetical protein
MNCITRPIILPVTAPMIKLGKKIPPGTAQPKVIVVKNNLIIRVANKRYNN